MNLKEVMEFLAVVYGEDKIEEFVGLGWKDVYMKAYQCQQDIAKVMVDDDFLFESERTHQMVLYKVIMIAAEKQIKNKTIEYS